MASSGTAPLDDTVIDNDKIKLVKRLQEYLPDAQRVSIAVGYFFISGFAPLIDKFTAIENSANPNHAIRLLMSPTTDQRTTEALLAGYEDREIVRRKIGELSRLTPEDVKRHVRESIEHMPQTVADRAVVAKVISLIARGKLQVRVHTKTRLHAKAYIFEYEDARVPRMSIIGSSNLTISGIRDHAELNLKTMERSHSDRLLEWFNDRWNDDGTIEFTTDVADLLRSSWAGKKYTPKEAYTAAAFREHGTIEKRGVGLGSTKIKLFDFQRQAVNHAIDKLENYGGVIVADVVGTGKSFIGGTILKYLYDGRRTGTSLTPLVICPPYLIPTWKEYMRDFDIPANVVSRYKIGDKNSTTLEEYSRCDAILVDESHNFRHANTRAYGALADFMDRKTGDARIIMLTATPVSNTVHDLKNQLNLFPAESIQRIPILHDTTLNEYFKGMERDGRITEEGKEKARVLLRHIMIRRTRTQIIDRFGERDDSGPYIKKGDDEKQYFPSRNLTNPASYDIDKVYNRSFSVIQKAIGNLSLARYAPGAYLKSDGPYANTDTYKRLFNSARSLKGIVRTTLLKRMESSIAAFRRSVEHYLRGTKEFRILLEKGIVPVGDDFSDQIYRMVSGEIDDDSFADEIAATESNYSIEAFDVKKWIDDLQDDEIQLAGLLNMLPEESKYYDIDDKMHTLRSLVDEFKTDKILIFTESAVTAKYLYAHLIRYFKESGQVERAEKMLQIDSDQGEAEKTVAVRRFDPENNPNRNTKGMVQKEDECDILVSTDVLSEGVNLQAGRVVINYDFHWNPVKLIQRVGRIDRIGSKHKVIEIKNFLPTSEVEESLSLKERVASKIRTIREIIGTDQKVLEATESIDEGSVQSIYAGDEKVLERVITTGILDTTTEAEIDAERLSGDSKELAAAMALPSGIRSTAVRKGRLLIALEADEHTDMVEIQDSEGSMYNAVTRIDSQKFVKRYVVLPNGQVKDMHQSTMLKRMRDSTDLPGLDEDDTYNLLVSYAWDKFRREMKSGEGDPSPSKVQKFFVSTLKRIGREDPALTIRVERLIAKVQERMVSTRQPYRALSHLQKEIDKNLDIDEAALLDRLDSIFTQYGCVQYVKTIEKPRIWYSMMVGSA